VLLGQWLFQQRVRLEVEHAQAQVQRSVPIAIVLVNLLFAQWLVCDGRSCSTSSAEACDFGVLVVSRMFADRHTVHLERCVVSVGELAYNDSDDTEIGVLTFTCRVVLVGRLRIAVTW